MLAARCLFWIGLNAAPSGGGFRKVERYFVSNKAGGLGEGSDGRFDGSLSSTASFDRSRGRRGAKAGERKALGEGRPQGSTHGGL